ncbi:ATP-dependent DNA ligase [Candidatus Pacearchaeota archaeon]|nr:ATP-dependent DNA ligase [Candidatus Pacearchaeota archaeon]
MGDNIINHKHMFGKHGDIEVLSKSNFIGFVFEPKHSGLRVFVHKDEDNIQLFDRLGKDITAKFPELLDVHFAIKTESCILDCELVVFDSTKKESQELLEIRTLMTEKKDIDEVCLRFPAKLFVFDIIEKNEINITEKQLRERKKIMKDLILNTELISPNPFTLDGKELWQNLPEDYSGIIAKDLNSKYEEGQKSWNWLKIKKKKTTECVLLGYRKNKNVMEILLGLFDSKFHSWFCPSAIIIEDNSRISNILGIIKEKELIQENSVLPEEELKRIGEKEVKKFKWLLPSIVLELKYDSINEKTIKDPEFLRIRTDKEAKECFI